MTPIEFLDKWLNEPPARESERATFKKDFFDVIRAAKATNRGYISTYAKELGCLDNPVSVMTAITRLKAAAYDRVAAELSAEGYACGRLEKIGGIFKGGCGAHVEREESYRCVDCTASFHRDCIRKHFGSHGKEA
jgi:hypothetical protein